MSSTPIPEELSDEEDDGSDISVQEYQPGSDDSPQTYRGFLVDLKITGSRLEYYGSGVSTCGYCKREPTQFGGGRRSYDMQALRLLPLDYQMLLDRGWRRSGNFCYYPINTDTCCPHYPISCKALKFKLSKSQRRCIERVNAFLLNGTTNYKVKLDYNHGRGSDSSSRLQDISVDKFDEFKKSSKARHRRFVRSCERKVNIHGMDLEQAIKEISKRRLARIITDFSEASLEDYLYPRQASLEPSVQLRPQHKLVIRLEHAESEWSKSMRNVEYEVLMDYQLKIHHETIDCWPYSRFKNFLIDSPIVPEPIQDHSYLPEREEPDDKHVIDITQTNSDDYILVKPPELPTSYGTYHCTYHLDGKLIAVGVLDVLPKCITSVYLFYDPAYGHLNLGIYSALVEISMVRHIAKYYNGLEEDENNRLVHYYMGFYVHECKKMHYKTTFGPSYLLCSETCEYVPTEICLQKLERRKYARFCTNPSNTINIHQRLPSVKEILDIPVLTPVVTSTAMIEYVRWLDSNLRGELVNFLINNFLVQYVRLVGRPLLSRISLQLNGIHQALTERYFRRYHPEGRPSSPNDSK